jgi:lysophospholipase L1-like esterase
VRPLWPVVAALIICALALGCGSGSSSAGLLPDGEGGVYVALGDSIARGANASDPARTGYPALLAGQLRERYGDDLRLESLADDGGTTEALIAEQLPIVLGLLEGGDVRLVTLTAGGNDLQQLAAHAACPADPADPQCPFGDVLDEIEGRLDRILDALTAARGDATIAMQLYPNLFSGTGHMFEGPAEYAFGRLNEVIAEVCKRHGVVVADPRAAFDGRGDEYTGTLDSPPDNHPNDAGYRVIADAFSEALGLSTADE